MNEKFRSFVRNSYYDWTNRALLTIMLIIPFFYLLYVGNKLGFIIVMYSLLNFLFPVNKKSIIYFVTFLLLFSFFGRDILSKPLIESIALFVFYAILLYILMIFLDGTEIQNKFSYRLKLLDQKKIVFISHNFIFFIINTALISFLIFDTILFHGHIFSLDNVRPVFGYDLSKISISYIAPFLYNALLYVFNSEIAEKIVILTFIVGGIYGIHSFIILVDADE